MAQVLRKSHGLFLHIPKCGGTWVEAVLNAAGIENRLARMTSQAVEANVVPRAAMPCQLHEREHRMARTIFTVVRSPETWYESWWKFENMPDRIESRPLDTAGWDMPTKILPSPRGMDFNKWVDCCLCLQPAFVTRMYELYCGPRDAPYAHLIGRLETIADDVAAWLHKCGHRDFEAAVRSTQPVNVSDGTTVWDPEMLARVRDGEVEAYTRWYGDDLGKTLSSRKMEGKP